MEKRAIIGNAPTMHVATTARKWDRRRVWVSVEPTLKVIIARGMGLSQGQRPPLADESRLRIEIDAVDREITRVSYYSGGL